MDGSFDHLLLVYVKMLLRFGVNRALEEGVICKLRSFIHGGKDQHKSCTAHHGEPLLCPCFKNYMQLLFFWLFFWAG